MPTAETLERFIARVEANAHAEAVEEFYTEDASMQENQSTPRIGRDAHVANERTVLSEVKTLTSQCIRPIFVSGDRVVVRWIFRFEWLNGTATHMEELAYQRWEGERIAEETFFYDPAQRVPKKLDPQ
jgi:SnoaL-like domain